MNELPKWLDKIADKCASSWHDPFDKVTRDETEQMLAHIRELRKLLVECVGYVYDGCGIRLAQKCEEALDRQGPPAC